MTCWQAGARCRRDRSRIIRDKMFRDEDDGRGRTHLSTAPNRSVPRPEEPQIVQTKRVAKCMQAAAVAAALELRSA